MYQNTEPARYWQDQLLLWGPKLLLAILILVITHFVAKAVQWAVARAIDKMPILKRHPGVGGDSIGKELGRLAYWIVWLVGLVVALQPLGLSGVLTPVTTLANQIAGYLDNILGAGIFFFAGLILARIVRHVVEAALAALNLERLAARAGLNLGDAPVAVDSEGNATGGMAPARSTIAKAVGMIVSATIVIFASIGALQILQITAISDPATAMLNTVALAIPLVLQAVFWLLIAFIVGKWAKSLIETVLPGLGFDNSVRALGVLPPSASPSRIVGAVAMTAILLWGLIEAADKLGGETTAGLLLQITETGGKVIFGTVIIVVGLFLARILANLVGSSTGEAGYAQHILKYAIIILFSAIGLIVMGLADPLVLMAFGLIVGPAALGAAIAVGLAFGLGGRDFAARKLAEWDEAANPPTLRRPPPPRLKKAPESGGDSQPPLV